MIDKKKSQNKNKTQRTDFTEKVNLKSMGLSRHKKSNIKALKEEKARKKKQE